MQTNKTIRMLAVWGFSACFAVLTSCKTSRFPICERLGNTMPSALSGVNQILYDACVERGIRITLLSSNIAEFRGPIRQMKWLQKNYALLICDFNQITSSLGATTCANCLLHSEKWIRLVQTGKLQELMTGDGVLYCPICIPNQKCF